MRRSVRSPLASLVLLFVSLFGAACATRAPRVSPALDGVEWRLVRFDDGAPAPEDLRVTFAFDGERVTGFAGCNRYFGGFEVGESRGALTIGLLGSTRMMCPADQMDVEERFLGSLQHVVAYDLVGDELRLTALRANRAMQLAFIRASGRPPEPTRDGSP